MTKTNDTDLVTMTFRVSPEEHRMFRMWCIAHRTTSQNILRDYVSELGQKFQSIVADENRRENRREEDNNRDQ